MLSQTGPHTHRPGAVVPDAVYQPEPLQLLLLEARAWQEGGREVWGPVGSAESWLSTHIAWGQGLTEGGAGPASEV